MPSWTASLKFGKTMSFSKILCGDECMKRMWVVYGKKRDEVSPRVTLFKITSRSSCMFDRGRQRSEKSRFLKAYSGLGINSTEILPSEPLQARF